MRKRGVLVVALAVWAAVGTAPLAAEACCGYMAAHFLWPFDGLEGVPVDAAMLAYYQVEESEDFDPERTISLVGPEGGELTGAATEQSFGGYVLETFVPLEELAPGTTYQLTVSTPDELTVAHSFTTADSGAAPGDLPVPEVEYQGQGVFPKCRMSSTATSSSTLALQIDGEGLEDFLVLVEVQDSAGNVVFETLVGGEYYVGKQKTIGSDMCMPHFEVDFDEHYCVRAAALNHKGEPGPFSDLSCSDAIGTWTGDHRVEFDGKDPDLVCEDGGDADSESTGPSTAGCTMVGSIPFPTWLLVLVVMSILTLLTIRRQGSE